MSSSSPIHWTSIVKQLRVEPFLFLYMFSYSLSSISISQLIQDKLCRQTYHQTSHFCLDINSPNYDHSNDAIKSQILTHSSYIALYRMMLVTIPCVIWSLFIGSWSDNYIHGRKILMCFGCIGAILESIALIINASQFNADVYVILLSFIPSALFGGIIATLMSTYAYCSATSDENTRSIRFAILEVCFWIPQPFGTFVGGQVLGDGDKDSEEQLYNYVTVFIVGLCAQLSALLWVIFMINEKKKSIVEVSIITREVFESNDSESFSESIDTSSTVTVEQPVDKFRVIKFFHHLKQLFDLKNVKDIFRTCTKPRPDKARTQIWLLFLSISCVLLSYMGGMIILWQYVEKLFSWSAKYYSNINSLVTVFTIFSMAIIVPVLVKRLKVRDMLLAIIGIVSLFAQCLFRGSWQRPTGLYLSYLFGMFAPITPIAIRSRLSKLVDRDEQGKIFSFMATVESLTPTLASVFYSSIFGASIDTYPGLAFQIAGVILFVPLCVMIWIDTCCVIIH